MDSMKELEYRLKYGEVLTIGSWKLYVRAGYWYVRTEENEPQPLQTNDFQKALLTLLEKVAIID